MAADTKQTKLCMTTYHDKKCMEAELAQIAEMRAQFGLTKNSLGGAMMTSETTLVIIGFFTSELSQQITSAAPDNRKIHVTVLAVCLSVLTFMSIELFVEQFAVLLWRLSRDVAVTLFRFLKFVCSLILVLTSHFVTDLMFEELGGGMSWVESSAIIIAAVLTIYLLLQLFHISSSF